MSLAYVKKICLFGGAGFVGRSIVRLLAKRGFEVKIATRSPFDEDLLVRIKLKLKQEVVKIGN